MRFLAARGRASNGTITELAAARRPDLLAESRAATADPFTHIASQAPADTDPFYRAWYGGHLDPYVFGGCPHCRKREEVS